MDGESPQRCTSKTPSDSHSQPTPIDDKIQEKQAHCFVACTQSDQEVIRKTVGSGSTSGSEIFNHGSTFHNYTHNDSLSEPIQGERASDRILEGKEKIYEAMSKSLGDEEVIRKVAGLGSTSSNEIHGHELAGKLHKRFQGKLQQFSFPEENDLHTLSAEESEVFLDNPLCKQADSDERSKDQDMERPPQLPPRRANHSSNSVESVGPPLPQPPPQRHQNRKSPPFEPPLPPRESSQSSKSQPPPLPAASEPPSLPRRRDQRRQSSPFQPPPLPKEINRSSEFQPPPLPEESKQIPKSTPSQPPPQLPPKEVRNYASKSPPQVSQRERVRIEKASPRLSRDQNSLSRSPQRSNYESSTAPPPPPSPSPSLHSRGSHNDNEAVVAVLAPPILTEERVQRNVRNVDKVESTPIEIEPAAIGMSVEKEILQSLDFLEENYEEIQKGELKIANAKCCTCCLNCSVSCFRLLKCCDCMERCSRSGGCCIPCKVCSGKSFSNDENEASLNGLIAAIEFIGSPSQWVSLLYRSFELCFFIFSIIYATMEAFEGFDDKLLLKIVALALTPVDLVLSIWENVTEWKETLRFYREKKKTNGHDLEKGGKMHESESSKDSGGWKFVRELVKKYVIHTLIYPLLICDIYDIASEANGKGILEYAVFGVGCFLLVVDVYLHRIILLIKASRDIEKKRMFAPERTDRVPCCRIEWRLVFHIIFVMIAHGFIITSIAFEAIETNKDRVEGDEVKISGIGMFMIACGFFLPFISLAIFVGTNVFWIRAYFIELFKSIWEEGESLGEAVNMRKKTKTFNAFKKVRSFDARSFHFIDRIRMSFSDWRTITASVVYSGLIIAFVVLARVSQPISAYGLAAGTFVADLLALSTAFYWVLVFSVLLTATAIIAGLCVVVAFCFLATRRSRYDLFDLLCGSRENEVVMTVTTVTHY